MDVAMTSHSRASEGTVLLQTATVTVLYPRTGESATCRIIFDLCSQRSYITKKLTRRLNAPIVGTEPLAVGGFGGHSTSGMYEIVNVGLRNRLSETIYVQVAVVETICSLIQGQRVDIASKEYQHICQMSFLNC